jgi:hypothetical protein
MRLLGALVFFISVAAFADYCSDLQNDNYNLLTSCKGEAVNIEEGFTTEYIVSGVDICVGKKYIKSNNSMYGGMVWYKFHGTMNVVNESGDIEVAPVEFNIPDGRVNHRSMIDYTILEDTGTLINAYSHRSEEKYLNIHHLEMFTFDKKMRFFNEIRRKGLFKPWVPLTRFEVNCQ